MKPNNFHNGIGIIGTRRRNSYDDLTLIDQAFRKIYEEGDIIVSGGCPSGGDKFAEFIAKNAGVPILIFPANWERYGKRAGFERNGRIAEYSTKALIACVSSDRTGGTEDTIKKYLKLYNNLIIV